MSYKRDHDPVATFVALYPNLVREYPGKLPPEVAKVMLDLILGVEEPRPRTSYAPPALPGPSAAVLRKKPSADGKVLRFRVVLLDVDPLVWRVIDMPSSATFWDLHVAIQDAFGWLDYHQHGFELGRGGVGVGIPNTSLGPSKITPSWDGYIAAYFRDVPEAIYTYDFGDDWRHRVVLEADFDADRASYPFCVDGANAAPPEDCGGPGGYEELKRVLAGKKNASYRSIKSWLSEGHAKVYWPFDPLAFDADDVVFTHAGFRLKRLLKELGKAE